MLGAPARIVGFVVACSLSAAAAFAGCGFQTEGIGASSASSGTPVASSTAGSGTPSSAAGTGGHGGSGASTSSSTVGTGGEHEDAGHKDASIDAPVDAEPVDAAPTAYASCQDWLTALPGAASGVYHLLDGMGNVYTAYCDMTTSDGGWTLALKIDGTNLTTLYYADPLWTNDTPLNADMPELDTNEAKLASFWSVPLTSLLVGMVENGTARWLVVALPVANGTPATLLDLVNLANKAPQTNLGRGPWEGLLAQGSLQTQCRWEGINPDGLVRIGIVDDDSYDCKSPDSYIGFGAVPTSSNQFLAPSPPSGNIAAAQWSPDNGGQATETFGYVLVR